MTRNLDLRPRSKKKSPTLAQHMLEVFLTSGPLGPGAEGEDFMTLARPMLLEVRRHFPEATAADFVAMLRLLSRSKKPWLSGERLERAALRTLVDEMAIKVMDEEVRKGKWTRSVDPTTGEVHYNKLKP